jgi:DTW domain-containing protein YfiP
MHAVHQLHQYRKSLSTTTYKARGQRVIRCQLCQLAKQYCICSLAPKMGDIESNAGFLFLMYDTEVLKPSNTGKLIADLIPDCYAFLWSRTQENKALHEVLNDEKWQPFVVFPQEYAEVGREVLTNKVTCAEGKKPLFVMLDGSWREAKKMFRKSPYLDKFPMVSFDAKAILATKEDIINAQVSAYSPVGDDSRYTVRKTELEHQFSTAEVGARVLDMLGEHDNAHLLDLWFDVFNFQYQKSVCQRNKGKVDAVSRYEDFLNQKMDKSRY